MKENNLSSGLFLLSSFLFSVFIVLVFPTVHYVIAKNDSTGLQKILSKIKSGNRIEVQEALQKYKASRTNLIENLIRIAQESAEKSTRTEKLPVFAPEISKTENVKKEERVIAPIVFRNAVSQLGKLRAKASVSFLISHIEYWNPSFMSREIIPRFPCAHALVKIGKPASNEILNVIKSHKKELNLKECFLFAEILWRVEGKEAALFRLRKLREHVEHPNIKKNLGRIIQRVKKVEVLPSKRERFLKQKNKEDEDK